MKKTALVVLFCLGSVLLIRFAHAEEPGFGGDFYIGGSVVAGRLSRLDASDGERRINSLNESGDHDTYVEPFLGGELRYTLPSGRTTFFVTSEHNDFELATGVRQSLGDIGTLSAAGTLGFREVWENPYLVGVSRRDTDETSWGASFEFENILGTGFQLSSDIARVDVDEDRIGELYRNLRRDGYRSSFSVGYELHLTKESTLVPALRYERGDMKGDANASDGCMLAVTYAWEKDRWGFEADAGIGRTEYRESHPIFNKERSATTYYLSTLVSYYEPFGWSQVSVFGLAAYHRVAENIDFFESDLWTVGIGLGYHF